MQSSAHAASYGCKSSISWGAIFAGVVVALSLEALFNLLGLALGFSAFMPDVNTVTNIGVGSLVWLAITGIISMFIGGWVAGKAAGIGLHVSGCLHGFVAWGLATLIVLLLTASAAGAIITAGAATIMNKDLSLSKVQTVVTQQNTAQKNATINQLQQTSQTASTTLGSIALATFIMFLLSAIAAIIGGHLGCRRNKHLCELHTQTVNTTRV